MSVPRQIHNPSALPAHLHFRLRFSHRLFYLSIQTNWIVASQVASSRPECNEKKSSSIIHFLLPLFFCFPLSNGSLSMFILFSLFWWCLVVFFASIVPFDACIDQPLDGRARGRVYGIRPSVARSLHPNRAVRVDRPHHHLSSSPPLRSFFYSSCSLRRRRAPTIDIWCRQIPGFCARLSIASSRPSSSGLMQFDDD